MTPQRKKKSKAVGSSGVSGSNQDQTSKQDQQQQQQQQQHAPEEPRYGIFVQDFIGFDTSLNIRPTRGARLIALNDESLDSSVETWTVQNIHEAIEKLNHIVNNDDTTISSKDGIKDGKITNNSASQSCDYYSKMIKLTFRNEILTKDQKETLFNDNDDGNATAILPISTEDSNNSKSADSTVDLKPTSIDIGVQVLNTTGNSLPVTNSAFDTPVNKKLTCSLPKDDTAKQPNKPNSNEEGEEDARIASSAKTIELKPEQSSKKTASKKSGIDNFFGIFAIDSSTKKSKYPFYNLGLTEAEKEAKNARMKRKKEAIDATRSRSSNENKKVQSNIEEVEKDLFGEKQELS